MTDTSKDWMMMHSGRHVFPLALTEDDINIEDMAHNLGQICRYNGSVDDFYSVAEHSVGISRALRRDGAPAIVQLQGLLHDGPEYIFGDMIRPMKNALAAACPDAMAFLKKHERRCEELIARKFALGVFDPRVKEYDDRIVNDEKAHLFGATKPWDHGGLPLGVDIQCWEPRAAARQFRHDFYKLHLEMGREV
jgi:hypothetical protein